MELLSSSRAVLIFTEEIIFHTEINEKRGGSYKTRTPTSKG
jgi:hypothetical protein